MLKGKQLAKARKRLQRIVMIEGRTFKPESIRREAALRLLSDAERAVQHFRQQRFIFKA